MIHSKPFASCQPPGQIMVREYTPREVERRRQMKVIVDMIRSPPRCQGRAAEYTANIQFVTAWSHGPFYSI